jgi:hypothetical protein
MIEAVNNRRINEALAQREQSMRTTLSGLWTRVANVAMGNEDADLGTDIGAFIESFPEFDDEVKQITDAFAGLSDAQDASELLQSQLDIAMSAKYISRDRSMLEDIYRVAEEHRDEDWTGDWVEHWTLRYEKMLKEMERDVERQEELDVWERTDGFYTRMYLSKLVDPDETVETVRDWLNKNHGPDGENNPRIGNGERKQWYQEVERWKEDPPHIRAALSGLAAKYDELIRQAEDEDERQKWTEEKENVLYAFRQEATEKQMGAQELEAAKQNLSAPLEEVTTDKTAVRILRGIGIRRAGQNPEELYVKWAEAGRLDDYGRLVGVSESEMLNALGLDDLSQLDFSQSGYFQKLGNRLREAGVDMERVLSAPRDPEIDLWEIAAGLEPHEVLMHDKETDEYWIFNRKSGMRYRPDEKSRPVNVPTEPVYEAQEPEPAYTKPDIRRGRR